MRISNLMAGGAISLVVSATALADQAPGAVDSGCERPSVSRVDMPPWTRPQGRNAPAWARNRGWGTERPARPPMPEWITERRERPAPKRPELKRPERPSLAAERPTPQRAEVKRSELPSWATDRPIRPSRPEFQRPTRPSRPEFRRPTRPDWANRGSRDSMRFRPVAPFSGATPFGRMPFETRRTLPYMWGRGWTGPGSSRGAPGWAYRNPWTRMGPMVEAPIPAPPPAEKPVPAPEPKAAPQPAPAPVISDSDTDGVQDPSDLCANTPAGAAVDPFGCPKDVPIVLRGVNFETDSNLLTPDSTGILDRVTATLLAHPEIKVEVAGHTDSDGDDVYNKDLSQRRAQTVMMYLTGKGVIPENLTALGYGEEQPIADNDTAAGKALNRRVELNWR